MEIRAPNHMPLGETPPMAMSKAEDLALDAIGQAVASTPLKRFVASAEQRGNR